MKNFHLLSTKELNPVQKRRLIEWGCNLTTYNFIRIERLTIERTTLYENLIFTSQNGVNCFLEQYPIKTELMQKKVFCVGEKTKALLEKKGFTVLHKKESAASLAQLIAAEYKGESGFSFICGKKRRPEIEHVLGEHNISVDCIETYTSHLQPKAFGAQDGVLFYSPSGVESYFQMNEIGTAQCFALGQTTASSLRPFSQHVHIAKEPTFDHLALCVHQYLNSN